MKLISAALCDDVHIARHRVRDLGRGYALNQVHLRNRFARDTFDLIEAPRHREGRQFIVLRSVSSIDSQAKGTRGQAVKANGSASRLYAR